ncbi:peptidyl-Lys metalloendopeptidase [Flagelloscypha sp. PMI_526]|nr:peptidyl-Lys metalloendopeptidase [Flagelloscypha sp. PMI_526]
MVALHFLLHGLFAFIGLVSANRHLTVSLSGPASVHGPQNFTVTATIKNIGHIKLKILNDPRGLLSTLPTDKFDITKDNCTVDFIGIRVKYVPETVINSNDSSAFTILEPGECKYVHHNLNEAYNFTQSGGGNFTIAPRDIPFFVVDEQAKTIHPPLLQVIASIQSIFHTAVTGTWPPISHIFIPGREKFVGCSTDQKIAIRSAAIGAHDLATSTLAYIASITTGTPRYTTWFGSYDSTHSGTVLSYFKAISANDFLGFTYDCTCDSGYAYVYADIFGTLYLCPDFWTAPLSGTNSKTGTIIHESSHFKKNGGTFDYEYGHKDTQALAAVNSDEAVMNADSLEYFAENTPPLN